jgi:hypothetical protein
MTCTEARAAIETADLGDLRANDDLLAEHLAGCDDCRELADVVVRGTTALAMTTVRRSRVARTRVRRVMAWSSAAAAATIVAVLVVNRRDPAAQPQAARVGSLPAARQVSLEVGRGQQATVLKTSDPTVTVIWLSSGEGK